MKKFNFPECRKELEYISLVQREFFNSGINDNEEVEPLSEDGFFQCVEDELGVFSNSHREKYTFTEDEIKSACAKAIALIK